MSGPNQDVIPGETQLTLEVEFDGGAGAGVEHETLGRELVRGLAAIRQHQLRTGEIPTYQRDVAGNFEYRRSPFLSTFVHDALGDFDPASPWLRAQNLELIPADYRSWFVRSVARVRQRIRAFIAWQRESNGVWRFFGRGSGMDPDSDDTSCAATVLLESVSARSDRWLQQQVHALRGFRSAKGIYYTWIGCNQRPYNGLDEHDRPIGFDRIVNANVLRYLALVGEDVGDLVAYLLSEVAAADFRTGSPYYPHPLCFFYMLARTWRQAQLPGMAEFSSSLIAQILSLQQKDGDFGGPLNTALALSALLDLAYTGPALRKATTSLLLKARPDRGWAFQDFFIHGFGSPAWTTALSMSVLARCDGLT